MKTWIHTFAILSLLLSSLSVQAPPKAVRGDKGAPNIWYIPEKHHKIIHSGSGRGGYYNAVWRIALEKLLTTRSYLTTQDIYTIRDQIVNAFDIWKWKP